MNFILDVGGQLEHSCLGIVPSALGEKKQARLARFRWEVIATTGLDIVLVYLISFSALSGMLSPSRIMAQK